MYIGLHKYRWNIVSCKCNNPLRNSTITIIGTVENSHTCTLGDIITLTTGAPVFDLCYQIEGRFKTHYCSDHWKLCFSLTFCCT